MEDLTEGLKDLAGEVRVVEMRDRAVRHSRRLRARRAAVAMGGAMCLLAAVIVGGNALWHGGGGRPEGPAGPGLDSAASGADGYVPAGTGYYLAGADDVWTVSVWREGAEPEGVMSGGRRFAETVSVSPDGRFAAYYDEAAMIVASLVDGSTVTSVQGVGDTCAEPAWAPDSSSVLLATASSAQLVDLSAGSPVVMEVARPQGCHARIVAYGDGFTGYVVQTPDRGEIRYLDADDGTAFAPPADYREADPALANLVAANADGSVLCLDTMERGAAAPARSLSCDTLATRSGPVEVPLPGDGANLIGASFLGVGVQAAVPGQDPSIEPSDGPVLPSLEVAMRVNVGATNVVLRGTLVAAYSGAGEVTGLEAVQTISTVDEPASLSGSELLAFVL